MHWRIEIWMYCHNVEDGYWAPCCSVQSTEMVGIVERALTSSGQTVRVIEPENLRLSQTTTNGVEHSDE